MKLDLYLVIGLTKESRHWSEEFIEELKTKLKPNSIQLVDLPGSGKLHHEKSPLSMEEIVDRARSQFTFHPGHQRIVIAISLGGMSAWSWVTRHPDDFTHMVMINSSLGNLSPFWKRVQPKAIFQFFRIAPTKRPTKKEKLILDLCSNDPAKAEKVYPKWVKIGEEANMTLLNTVRQIIAASRFNPKLKPKIPLLVVASKHDRLAHFSCSEAIAEHAKAKLVLTDRPEVGHAFHVDGPELLADSIQSWLAGFTESASNS